jgi:hypothetical protein
MSDKEREMFEVWFTKEFLEPTADNAFVFRKYAYGYLLADVQKAYIAWQHQAAEIKKLRDALSALKNDYMHVPRIVGKVNEALGETP